MPPPAEVPWIPPASSACGSGDVSSASQASRSRFVNVNSSASDSFRSAPAGSEQVKIGRSDVYASVVDGAVRASELKLNTAATNAGSGEEVGFDFVFGSSQFRPASNFSSEGEGFREHFQKLNLGDIGKTKVEAAAWSQEVKNRNAAFNFQFRGNLKTDNGFGGGVFVFKGNKQSSSVHDTTMGGKGSDEGRSKGILDDDKASVKNQNDKLDVADSAKASVAKSQVTPEAGFSIRSDSEVSHACPSGLSAASVKPIPHIEVHDPVESDTKTKTFNDNIFVFGSSGIPHACPSGLSAASVKRIPHIEVHDPVESDTKTKTVNGNIFVFGSSGIPHACPSGLSAASVKPIPHIEVHDPVESDTKTKTVNGNIFVFGSSGIPHACPSGLSAASVKPIPHIEVHDPVESDTKTKTVNGNIFVFGSSGIPHACPSGLSAPSVKPIPHIEVHDPVESDTKTKTVNGNIFVFGSSGIPHACPSGLSAPSVKPIPHIEVHDPVESDTKTKTVNGNIFVFGRSGIPIYKPFVSMVSPDPSCLKTNMFSSPTEVEFSEQSCTTRRNILEKSGNLMGQSTVKLSSGTQNLAEVKIDEENSSSSNCYSPMDFSPYQERSVDHQSSMEKEANEPLSSDCGLKISCPAKSVNVELDISGSSGDRLVKAASGPTRIGTVSGLETSANQPENVQGRRNIGAGNKVQFSFSSKKSDPETFVFSASASLGTSALKGEHHLRKSNAEPVSASSSTSPGAAMEDVSSALRGQSGCSSDNSFKVAPRRESVIPRKLRPRLVKLRKHSHRRSETMSTHEKAVTSDPLSTVPDGHPPVKLDNTHNSTSDNTATQEVDCSFRNTGFVFGGSGRTPALKSNTSEEDCYSSEWGNHDNIAAPFSEDASEKMGNLSSGVSAKSSVECGFVFGSSKDPMDESSDNGVFIFKSSSERSGERSTEESNHGEKPNNGNFECTSDILSSGNHGLDGGGKDEGNLSSTLPDGMQKLNTHDLENAGDSRRNDSPGCGPFVLRSCTQASHLNADDFPSSSDDHIKDPNTGFRDGVQNGNNIRCIGEEHIMFGLGDEVPKFGGLPKTEEKSSGMQFPFASRVDKANQGCFVFSASTSDGLNSPIRKYLRMKRNNVQRKSVSFGLHPELNSSTTCPFEEPSDRRREVSSVYEDEDNSYLSGQKACEQKEVPPSASIQEACEKWRFRGNQAYKNGHFSRAERFYTKGIDSVPSHETAGCCLKPLLLCYSNRAATRMSVGRLREAIHDCTKAAALDPNFLKVQIRAANCHLVLGETDDAISCFGKCLESGANVCLDRRLLVEAADGLQRAQKVAEHTKLCRKILEEKCSDFESTALKLISEAMSISKFSEALLQMKAEALYTTRKYEEVIQLCEQSLLIAEKNLPTLDVPKGSENVDGSKCEGKSSVKLWRFFLMAKSNFSLGRLAEALDLLQKVEMTECISDSEVMESAASLSTNIRKLLDCKNSGNEAFRSKKYAEAVEHYTTALSSSGESRPFAAICFCNRAAAHQALGQIADAIADCSLATALDGNYAKAVSRRATLHEMIRHYEGAASDDCRLILILQNQSSQKTKASSGPSDRAKELREAYRHRSSMEEEAKKGAPLDIYLILGVKKSDTAADIKKAYRKAALRHHPDKAGQFLRSDSGHEGWLWKEIAEVVHEDADRLFKIIGEAYAVLSDTSKRAEYDLEEDIRKTRKESRVDTSYYPGYYRNSSDYSGSASWRNSSRRYGHENMKTYGYSHSRW